MLELYFRATAIIEYDIDMQLAVYRGTVGRPHMQRLLLIVLVFIMLDVSDPIARFVSIVSRRHIESTEEV